MTDEEVDDEEWSNLNKTKWRMIMWNNICQLWHDDGWMIINHLPMGGSFTRLFKIQLKKWKMAGLFFFWLYLNLNGM